jgi:hypothetical protein
VALRAAIVLSTRLVSRKAPEKRHIIREHKA